MDFLTHCFLAASASNPVGQVVTQAVLSLESNLVPLHSEQIVALEQVLQSVILHVAFYNTLLLLRPAPVALAVVLVVFVGGVVVGGGAVAPSTKELPDPGQEFLADGQIVLLHAMNVATVKAVQVESINSDFNDSE